MKLWDAVKKAFGVGVRPSAMEALALASVSADTVGALSDEELRRLENLCHEAIEASVDTGREEPGIPLLVASDRGIGVNGAFSPTGYYDGFRLQVTPEGINAGMGDGYASQTR